MTNELKRAILRTKNIDIEVTVVSDIRDNKTFNTGRYRYLVSQWQADGKLIKNHYTDQTFANYTEAENAALELGYQLADEKMPYPNYVD